MPIDPERFEKQLAFVKELDRLKTVLRRTYILDGSRTENDAEHSWQIAAMALLFAEYADQKKLDMLMVVKILLFHDVIEIDAGDTYIYDEKARASQAEREQAAAERIYGLLPEDQKDELRVLWEDFESGATPEARFARAIDRFQPLLHNYLTRGKAWQEHDVSSAPVRAVNRKIAPGSKALWEYADKLITESVRKSFLKE